MPDVADFLQLIDQFVPEGAGEVVASLILVGVVVGVRHLAGRLRSRWSGDPYRARRLLVTLASSTATAVVVLVFVGVWGLLDDLTRSLQNLGLTSLGPAFVLSAVLIAGAYVITSLLSRFMEEIVGARGHLSQHHREVIYRLTQVTLYSIVGLTIISLFTENVGSLLVGAGFLGIVIGMASRQTLGAALAGFVLMFSRPFEIGDWVEVGDHEGVVNEITIVNTRIRTFDGEYVVLPNDEVSGSAIVNRTRRGRLRVEVEVGVDYDSDPERAADVALRAVRGLDRVLTVPSPQVVLKQFADSSVVLGVRFWIDNPSARGYWRARTDVISAVKDAFEEEGIKIPFPQRELTGRAEDGGLRVAGDGQRAEQVPEREAEE